MANTIPKYPKIGLSENLLTTWLIIPNAGKIKI